MRTPRAGAHALPVPGGGLAVLSFLAAVLISIAVIWSPIAAAAAVALTSTAIVGAASPTFARRATLQLIGFLLVGYAFFGKAFAYLGVPPVYIGEVVLFLATILGLASRSLRQLHRSGLLYALMLLAAWCAVRTLPYVSVYGWNALRDAALWGYSLFALIVVALVRNQALIQQIAASYGQLIPAYLLWVLLLGVLRVVFPEISNIRGPGGIPVFVLKAGDVTVHLAGLAAFLALKLNRLAPQPLRAIRSEWFLWVLISLSFLFYASQNRGGLLAFVVAMALLTILGRKRLLLKALACFTAIFLALITFDYELDAGLPRKISPEQILENIRSIGKQDDSPFEGTKRWRLAWWRRIADYTVFGPYRWSGKGFGVNLADDDGFQANRARLLRSPHSAHFTFLARGGIPGLVLWLLVLGVFAATMVRGILRTTGTLRSMMLWILVYWVAALVNASFDVYLEGPQGGIWFWSLVGLGMSAVQVARHRPQASGVCSPRYVA
ncbi:MAG TPA: O-antigen ligase family protein [Bryobacteraceae bacterium]|nr:O-antigen ligase family protein [Bryobacteraceae bacterium]